MYRAAIVLQDDTDPAFSAPPAGSLFAGGTLAGTHGVSFSATDTGSGVQQATLEVDGTAVATQTLGCAPPYTAIVPCKLSASGTVTLDTATLTDGPHAVRRAAQGREREHRGLRPVHRHDVQRADARARRPPRPSVVTTRPHARTIAYGGAAEPCAGTVAGAAPGRSCA